MAIGAEFAIAFLPFEPGFLDGIGARAAIDVGEVKEFAEAAAFGAPTLGGVVAEHFGIEGFEGAGALRAGALGGVDGQEAMVIEGEKCAATELEGFVDELLGRFGVPAS